MGQLLTLLLGGRLLETEELVLKIAILAEKNAPNFGWYVDVTHPALIVLVLSLAGPPLHPVRWAIC